MRAISRCQKLRAKQEYDDQVAFQQGEVRAGVDDHVDVASSRLLEEAPNRASDPVD